MEEQLFVVAGLNRLTVQVVTGLRSRRPAAEVVIVAAAADPVYGPMVERLQVSMVYADRGMEPALREAVQLSRATCLLALHDSDLENVRAAVIAHAVAPDVPIVVRLFDRILADQLERQDSNADDRALRVRRAYSMSALSAPRFLAAALGDAEAHLLTMRLAEGEFEFLRMTAGAGSPVVGRTVGSLERHFGCTVLARRGPDGAWRPAPPDRVELLVDDGLVVAGAAANVFRLASENQPRPALSSPRSKRLPSRSRAGRREKRQARNITLLPRVAIGLTLVIVASLAVVGVWGGGHVSVDAFYWTVTAAASGAPAGDTSSWLRILAVVPILAGGALSGVLFSYLASVATAQRLEQRSDRRASRMTRHVVVGGLGTVGYRVERLLWLLGVPTVVVELAPDAQFALGLERQAPLLQGDIRLTSNLERAGIRSARCLIAVTDDDLVNLEACLSARALNPEIRTVARIFDETLADRAREAFGIDECFAASEAAAPAFVDAATDPQALRRFRLEGAGYRGVRYVAARTVESDEIAGWRSRGVRVVATWRPGDSGPSSTGVATLQPGDLAIVAGPEDDIQLLADTGSLA